MDGGNRSLKQLQQTTARCFPCTVESVQHTPALCTTKLLAKTLTVPREDALRLFPIGTTVVKESGSRTLSGQIYDYRVPYCRVQYEDNDREQLARQEVHRMLGARSYDTQGRTS